MSRKYAAVPPPGYAQISNVDNGSALSNDGFAMPLPPPQQKPSMATSQPSSRKRRSRFSDAPPSASAPPPPTVLTDLPVPPSKKSATETTYLPSDNKSALVSAAAAAAARINANLKAQGKIKESASTQLTSQSTASPSATSRYNPVDNVEIKRVDDMYSTEVEINDMPIGCRNYLTRLSTQESINKSCSAYVSTRGKFMTAEEKKLQLSIPGADKPIYLFVQSQNEASVRKALERIKQIINNHFEKKSMFQSQALAQIASLSQKGQTGVSSNAGPTPNTLAQAFTPGYPLIPTTTVAQMPHSQPSLPCGNFIQEKLFIGLDGLPDNFDLKSKLLGPNYRNFNFISNQSGAKVILRGKGSGFIEPTSGQEAFESMYAFISHPNQSGVDAAKRLVQNLIDTIKKEIPPYMLNMTTQSAYGGAQFASSGNYRNVPPPAAIAPPSNYTQPNMGTQSQMTAYPFQQANPGMMMQSTYPNQTYNYGSGYQSYQHNFSGNGNTENMKTNSENTMTGGGDRRKKKFTEQVGMPPPLPPEPATHEKKANDEDGKPGNTSLPFWMAP